MDPDDPMAYLSQQREKLEAMQAMASVGSMQAEVVATVQSRMARIRDIENGVGGLAVTVDPEVEAWRRKIAGLVAAGPKPSGDEPPPPRPRGSRGMVDKSKSRRTSSLSKSGR